MYSIINLTERRILVGATASMEAGKVFLSPRGRINRKTFWFASISLFVLYVIADMMRESTDEVMSALGSLFILPAVIWPTIAVHIKRWHDRNKSGWWYLINFVPIVGPFWTLIELGFLKGTPGANRYGFPPGTRESYDYGPMTPDEDYGYIPPPLPDLIAMFAKIAKSDGVVSRAEISLIDDFFITILRFTPQMRKEAIKIFNRAKLSAVPYEVYTKRFYAVHKENLDILKVVADFLLALGLADGKLSAECEILISQTLAIFGIEYEVYAEHRERKEQREQEPHKRKGEKYYAEILGLGEDITPSELKRVYRNLAIQYHPDKVVHLGPKLKQVAEEEMKRINEAYAFFREKYAFSD